MHSPVARIKATLGDSAPLGSTVGIAETNGSPTALESALDGKGPVCTHHWVLEAPNGSMSKGICKLCGEEREFPNAMPESSAWEGNGGGSVKGKPITLHSLAYGDAVKTLASVPKPAGMEVSTPVVVETAPPALCEFCKKQPRTKGSPYCSRDCRRAAKEKRAEDRKAEAVLLGVASVIPSVQPARSPEPQPEKDKDYWEVLLAQKVAIEDLFEPEDFMQTIEGMVHHLESHIQFMEGELKGLRPALVGLKETLARMRHAGVRVPHGGQEVEP